MIWAVQEEHSIGGTTIYNDFDFHSAIHAIAKLIHLSAKLIYFSATSSESEPSALSGRASTPFTKSTLITAHRPLHLWPSFLRRARFLLWENYEYPCPTCKANAASEILCLLHQTRIKGSCWPASTKLATKPPPSAYLVSWVGSYHDSKGPHNKLIIFPQKEIKRKFSTWKSAHSTWWSKLSDTSFHLLLIEINVHWHTFVKHQAPSGLPCVINFT